MASVDEISHDSETPIVPQDRSFDEPYSRPDNDIPPTPRQQETDDGSSECEVNMQDGEFSKTSKIGFDGRSDTERKEHYNISKHMMPFLSKFRHEIFDFDHPSSLRSKQLTELLLKHGNPQRTAFWPDLLIVTNVNPEKIEAAQQRKLKDSSVKVPKYHFFLVHQVLFLPLTETISNCLTAQMTCLRQTGSINEYLQQNPCDGMSLKSPVTMPVLDFTKVNNCYAKYFKEFIGRFWKQFWGQIFNLKPQNLAKNFSFL